ncbi:MAG: hypothetical protein GY797_22930 [Deltaproteobacteria bacterium]|nr:hypothetical protein [Deltaproteobacteria bacterium]
MQSFFKWHNNFIKNHPFGMVLFAIITGIIASVIYGRMQDSTYFLLESPIEAYSRFEYFLRSKQWDKAYAMIDEESKLRARETYIEFLSLAIQDSKLSEYNVHEFLRLLNSQTTRQIHYAFWEGTRFFETKVISKEIKGDIATLIVRDFGLVPYVDWYRYMIKKEGVWLLYHPREGLSLVNPEDAKRIIRDGIKW